MHSDFRVSVDGDWLCLKELDDGVGAGGDDMMDVALSPHSSSRGKWTPTTPEFEQMVRYPTYPVGRTGITRPRLSKFDYIMDDLSGGNYCSCKLYNCS